MKTWMFNFGNKKRKEKKATGSFESKCVFLYSLRFSQLKSLNLSHNRLGVFPECVCEILTLTELSLSCNSLQTVPVQIGNLQRCDTEFHTAWAVGGKKKYPIGFADQLCSSLHFMM